MARFTPHGITGQALLLGAALLAVGLLPGCAVKPAPLTADEIGLLSAEQGRELTQGVEPVSGPVSLAEAIARGLKYNLDHRVKMMEQAQALKLLDASQYDLLPKLAASAGYTAKDSYGASTSRLLFSRGEADPEPTYSAERRRATADLTMTWNALDFGVSYFNAKQQADRALIAQERRRKVIHNLVQEIRAAYWRAATSRSLRQNVSDTVARAEAALADARRAEEANIKNPLDILRYQRTLVESIRQLESIDQDLATAKTELAVLIGLPPATPFEVQVPSEAEFSPPAWDMTVEQMEEVALRNNPDLREAAYLSRISVAETRKAFLRMLPGLNLSLNHQYDSNSFLVDNQWTEAGARISWNLLSILSGPAGIKAAELGEQVAKTRSLAMHMAVLAQAHIARRQYEIALKQYERANEMLVIDQRILRAAVIREELSAQGELDRISSATTTIVGVLRRYQTLAQVHASLSRMQAAVGMAVAPEALESMDVPALTQAVARSMTGLGRPAQPAGGAL